MVSIQTPHGTFTTGYKRVQGLSLYRCRWSITLHGKRRDVGELAPIWHRSPFGSMVVPKLNGWGEHVESYDLTGKPVAVLYHPSWREVKALRELEKAVGELRPIPPELVECLANVRLSRDGVDVIRAEGE